MISGIQACDSLIPFTWKIKGACADVFNPTVYHTRCNTMYEGSPFTFSYLQTPAFVSLSLSLPQPQISMLLPVSFLLSGKIKGKLQTWLRLLLAPSFTVECRRKLKNQLSVVAMAILPQPCFPFLYLGTPPKWLTTSTAPVLQQLHTKAALNKTFNSLP